MQSLAKPQASEANAAEAGLDRSTFAAPATAAAEIQMPAVGASGSAASEFRDSSNHHKHELSMVEVVRPIAVLDLWQDSLGINELVTHSASVHESLVGGFLQKPTTKRDQISRPTELSYTSY